MSDDEYHRLLKKFAQDVRNALTIKKTFERLIQAGRRTGLTDIQIGDDIKKELKGELGDSTVRKYLPHTMKHEEKINKRYALRVAHQSEQPEIDIPPPSHQVVKVAETYEEIPMSVEPLSTEHVKEFVVDLPIGHEIILDCRKFKTELRMGTLNNAKLKLKVKDNEVIKVVEI